MVERGSIDVKGKGQMDTYWLVAPGELDPDGVEDHLLSGK